MKNAFKLELIKLKYYYKIILAMIGLTLLMIFLFSQGSAEPVKQNVLIINPAMDNEINTTFVDSLTAMNQFSFSVQSSKEKIELSNYIAVINLPNDLSNTLNNNQPLNITLDVAKDDVSISLLKNSITKVINQLYSQQRSIALIENTLKTNESHYLHQRFQNYYNYKKPMKLSTTHFQLKQTNNNLNHSVIGFCILFVSYTVIYQMATILEEVETKTWQRQLIGPLSIQSLIASKSAIAYIIGIIEIIGVFMIVDLVFNGNFMENFLGLFMIASLYILSLVALGLLAASLSKTYKQLSAGVPIVLTSLAMIGGCLWPLEIVTSKLLLLLANITPHKWTISGMKKIMLSGLNVSELLPEILFLSSMTIIIYSLGLFFLNKKNYT